MLSSLVKSVLTGSIELPLLVEAVIDGTHVSTIALICCAARYAENVSSDWYGERTTIRVNYLLVAFLGLIIICFMFVCPMSFLGRLGS